MASFKPAESLLAEREKERVPSERVARRRLEAGGMHAIRCMWMVKERWLVGAPPARAHAAAAWESYMLLRAGGQASSLVGGTCGCSVSLELGGR